jgi:hypothetical protein
VLVFASGERLESLRFGDLEVRLRREAAAAERNGDTEAAAVLKSAADTLAQRAVSVARRYESVRSSLPAGAGRTERMAALVREAQQHAHDPGIDQDQILNWLWTGSEGRRVWALGVLRRRPELATTRALLEALERPDHLFDWRQTLIVARDFLPRVDEWHRERIAGVVQRLRDSGEFATDPECAEKADLLLAEYATLKAHDTKRRPEAG